MVEETVRRFITEELTWGGRPEELTDDLRLLDANVVDSMGLFSLVSFLESEYSIEIGDEELVPSNFSTLKSIARFVEEKRARPSGS